MLAEHEARKGPSARLRSVDDLAYDFESIPMHRAPACIGDARSHEHGNPSSFYSPQWSLMIGEDEQPKFLPLPMDDMLDQAELMEKGRK